MQNVLTARLREAGVPRDGDAVGVSRLAFPAAVVEIEASAVADAT